MRETERERERESILRRALSSIMSSGDKCFSIFMTHRYAKSGSGSEFLLLCWDKVIARKHANSDKCEEIRDDKCAMAQQEQNVIVNVFAKNV